MMRSFLQFRCDGPMCGNVSEVIDRALCTMREALAAMRQDGWTRKHGGLDFCPKCSKRNRWLRSQAAPGPSLFDPLPESGITKLSPSRDGAAESLRSQKRKGPNRC